MGKRWSCREQHWGKTLSGQRYPYPLLKRLETKGFIQRKRKKEDERVVEVFITESGKALQKKACEIPEKIHNKIDVTKEDWIALKESVQKILSKIEK